MSAAPRQPTAIIASNGWGGGPAEALLERLLDGGVTVTAVTHPLLAEHGGRHDVEVFSQGARVRRRRYWSPLRPTASFALDPLIPPILPKADVFFGFNPLAAARGLFERWLGRSRRVVAWSVDFVPDRFGTGALTRLYDAVDKRCALAADVHVELSDAARRAREVRHGIVGARAPVRIVPMGAWLARIPTTTPESFAARRVVYLGHLVSRQGVDILLDVASRLSRTGDLVAVDVIGTGDAEKRLRDQVSRLGIEETVTFHGFVADHTAVEHLLARCSLGIAPYRRDRARSLVGPTPGS